MSRFDSIPVTHFFRTLDGEQFRKISAQVYIDPLTGIETYWDPIFDTKIALPGSGPGRRGERGSPLTPRPVSSPPTPSSTLRSRHSRTSGTPACSTAGPPTIRPS